MKYSGCTYLTCGYGLRKGSPQKSIWTSSPSSQTLSRSLERTDDSIASYRRGGTSLRYDEVAVLTESLPAVLNAPLFMPSLSRLQHPGRSLRGVGKSHSSQSLRRDPCQNQRQEAVVSMVSVEDVVEVLIVRAFLHNVAGQIQTGLPSKEAMVTSKEPLARV